MKRLYLFLTIILAGVLIISCAKNNAHEQFTLPETKSNTNEFREYHYSDKDITCIEGILHFKTSDAFFNSVNYLLSEKADIEKFNKTYNFTSLASRIQTTMDAMREIQDEQLRINTTRHYSNLVEYLGKGEFVSAIGGRGYTLIANPEGVYYVGGIKYTITSEKLIAETPVSEKNPNGKIEILDYLAPVNLSEENMVTKATQETAYYFDERYEGSDRKVFCRLNLVRLVTTSPYQATYTVQIHMSAQKKVLFTWNSYKTNYTITYPYISIGALSVPPSGPVLPSIYESGGDYLDWYKTWSVPGIYTTPTWPSFNSVNLHAKSGGTNPCGAVIKYGVSSGYNQCNNSWNL
jgi:hypothetical protein